jgi:hypothetical protein
MVRCAIRPYDGAVAVTCPKCKRSSIFARGPLPLIDRCGFELHSFRCEWCASYLAGVVDPIDDVLVISLLEESSGVAATPPSDPLSGQPDLQCDIQFPDTEEQSSS